LILARNSTYKEVVEVLSMSERDASRHGSLTKYNRPAVGGRQPVADHTGKPCGCGCGKVLEHHYYKTCFTCADKDPSIA